MAHSSPKVFHHDTHLTLFAMAQRPRCRTVAPWHTRRQKFFTTTHARLASAPCLALAHRSCSRRNRPAPPTLVVVCSSGRLSWPFTLQGSVVFAIAQPHRAIAQPHRATASRHRATASRHRATASRNRIAQPHRAIAQPHRAITRRPHVTTPVLQRSLRDRRAPFPSALAVGRAVARRLPVSVSGRGYPWCARQTRRALPPSARHPQRA